MPPRDTVRHDGSYDNKVQVLKSERITVATVRCPDRFKNIADFFFLILGHDETDIPQFQSALGKKDLQEKVGMIGGAYDHGNGFPVRVCASKRH